MSDGLILKSQTVKPLECLHFAMHLPTSVVITGIDSLKILDQALEAVRTFKPMTDAEIDELLKRTAEVAKTGQYELFKIDSPFDGTAKNPSWLGEATKLPGV